MIPNSARLRWGWLEWFVVLQTAAPALLFIPGLDPIRTLSRMVVFGLAIIAWIGAFSSKRPPGAGSSKFVPRVWLAVAAVWMTLSIAHPYTNSLLAGVAATVLAVAVFAPAFWASELVDSSDRLRRLIIIVFLCQSLNSVVGVLQAVNPDWFLPPALKNPDRQRQLLEVGHAYTGPGGKIIVRPSGLTDSPGAASAAGSMTCLLGLGLVILPGRQKAWFRALAAILACFGLAVVLFTMVRAALVTLLICIAALTAILIIQKLYRQASILMAGSAVLAIAVLAGIAGTGVGSQILIRFATLFENTPTQVMTNSRGMFIAQAFDTMIWDFPLGGGLGRWGMIHQNFGNHTAAGQGAEYWVEVQWNAWILDGGAVLLIAYAGAMILALWDTFRIARQSRVAPDTRHWAGAVLALNLSIAALTFSYVPFQSPIGTLFWLLAASVHGASRVENRGSLEDRGSWTVDRGPLRSG